MSNDITPPELPSFTGEEPIEYSLTNDSTEHLLKLDGLSETTLDQKPFLTIDVPTPPEDALGETNADNNNRRSLGRSARIATTIGGSPAKLSRREEREQASEVAIQSWLDRKKGKKSEAEDIIERMSRRKRFYDDGRNLGLADDELYLRWRTVEDAARIEDEQMKAERRRKLAEEPPVWPDET